MSANHTPTPYRVQTHPDGRQCILDAKGNDACVKANAAFIVRACNNHDALLAALESLAFYSKQPGTRGLFDAQMAAESIIAQAKGNQS